MRSTDGDDRDGYSISYRVICKRCGGTTAGATYQPFHKSAYATMEEACAQAAENWNKRTWR